MTTTFDSKRFVNDFAHAFREKDAETLLGYYAENAELEDPSTPKPLRGKEAIRRNFDQWSRAFGEGKAEIHSSVQSGKDVAILYDMSGRHIGELELSPGETIPATNKNVTMRIAEFLKLDDQGKIVSDRTVFDLVSMMTQLGLMPSPQAGGTAQSRATETPKRSR